MNERSGSSPGNPPLEPAAVEDPAALIRLATTAARVRAELDGLTLDDSGVQRLVELDAELVSRLSELVTPELVEEIEGLLHPTFDGQPSASAARLAHSQLVGWIEGLLAGVQAEAAAARSPQGGREIERQRSSVEWSTGGEARPSPGYA